MIDHTTESTDRYIKDGTRVEKLYMSGYSEWEISFFTGIPGYIVREYIDIVKSYENEMSNNGIHFKFDGKNQKMTKMLLDNERY